MAKQSNNQRTALKEKKIPVVGIGASAGGLKALEAFFDAVPENCGMAFVVIVHLSPDHPSSMAELLQSHTSMEVTQVNKRIKVKPDHVYIIPPQKLLKMVDGYLEPTEPVKKNNVRLAIDLFFRSLAVDAEDRAVAIVLSGTGSDGTLGLKTVKERGGAAMAQDPDEAEHGGMPQNAISTGLVDMVLPVQELARKLVGYKENLTQIKVKVESEDNKLPKDQETLVADILERVASKTGHDFLHYKRSSVLRRIKRRLQVTHIDNLSNYLGYMKNNPAEADELFNDLLISVTSFFRDEEAFRGLEQKVIARFFEDHERREELRIWVPGCATGEEAYSIAMLLHEHSSQTDNAPPVQVFATDIDKNALGIAREGIYHKSVEMDVGPDRFKRYFYKENYGYRIKKEIRDMVLFTVHDLLRDPPFTKLDLISCRNLLIYLNREMQSEVFNLFHYALHSGGFLFLGLSDSNLEATGQFVVEDKKHQIYRQNQGYKKKLRLPNIPLSQNIEKNLTATWKYERREKADFGELHRKLLAQQYAPASVIIDKNYDVIHSEGDIGKYLQYKTGEPSRNILGMAVPEIHRELRSILYQYSRSVNKKVIKQQIQNYLNDELSTIELVVQPVKTTNFPEGFLQVVFRNIGHAKRKPDLNGDGEQTEPDVERDMVRELEEELIFTKEQLQVSVEEYETSNEELRASNEELQSMNEELQSTTEELKTSKEELQSVNEELKSVNQELESKVEKLHHANDDLKNLMETTEVGVIFVDNDLVLQLHTARATELFNIIESDTGRPLEHITHQLDYENLIPDIEEVLETLNPLEKMVHSKTDQWYIMRIRPYRTLEDDLGGVVMSFVDVTQLKITKEKLAARTRQQEALLRLELYMLNSREMQQIMDKTLQMLQKELKMEYCILMKLNAEDETLNTVASAGWGKEDIKDLSLPANSSWDAGYTMKTKEQIITVDYTREDRFKQPATFAKLDIKSSMSVVIEGTDGDFGVLSIYSQTPRTFSESEITFIRVVANALGGAVKREQINQSLHDEIKQSRKLQRQIIKVSNAKRWEVGQYLHDNLAQTVIAAKLNTSFLASRIKEMDADMGAEVEKLEQSLEEMAENVRELSHGLIPLDVETGGLEYALKYFSDNMKKLFDLECEFNLEGSEGLIQNRHIASDLLNIIQEAAKNAVRHGNANKIIVQTAVEGEQLLLTIEDDGTGLDEGYDMKEGMGTNIMRHRVQLMGGSLNMERISEEGGTRVTCLIPLKSLAREE